MYLDPSGLALHPLSLKHPKLADQSLNPKPYSAHTCNPGSMTRMLFLGDGVEADAEYAMRFLKLAAERDDASECLVLNPKPQTVWVCELLRKGFWACFKACLN